MSFSEIIELYGGLTLLAIAGVAGLAAVLTSLVVLAVVMTRPSVHQHPYVRIATGAIVAVISTISGLSLAMAGSWIPAAAFALALIVAIGDIVKAIGASRRRRVQTPAGWRQHQTPTAWDPPDHGSHGPRPASGYGPRI